MPAAPKCRETGQVSGPLPCCGITRNPGWSSLHRRLRPVCPGSDIGYQPAYPYGSRFRFRRCSCRKFCAAVGALSIPSGGVPRLELARWDVRPVGFPLFRRISSGCGTEDDLPISLCFAPLPLSHLLREDNEIRVSRVRQFSLTVAASVTFVSWQYGSASRLAPVPHRA